METAQIATQMYPGRLKVRSVAPAMTAPVTITMMANCTQQDS